jgi:hypothetical protein
MGWVAFFVGCLVTIPVGWLLLSRSHADRLLSVIGLVMLPPTVWTAALGLGIGPCEVGSCVTHKQHNLLALGVAALVVLALALAALALARPIPAALLMTAANVLALVSVVKIDVITAIMYLILGGGTALYLMLALLPARSRSEPGLSGTAF